MPYPEGLSPVLCQAFISPVPYSISVTLRLRVGTPARMLYITGGVCLVTGMALKQLGSVKGARKRLGQ